jgi:hypothetical protein
MHRKSGRQLTLSSGFRYQRQTVGFNSYAMITFHFSSDGLTSGRAVAHLSHDATERFRRAELTISTHLLHRKGAKQW